MLPPGGVEPIGYVLDLWVGPDRVPVRSGWTIFSSERTLSGTFRLLAVGESLEIPTPSEAKASSWKSRTLSVRLT